MGLKIIIPAAGEGRRFSEAGYSEPKPFLRLPNGKPMLQEIVDRAWACCPEVVVVLGRAEHEERGRELKHCVWSNVHETTEGAADTVALADVYMDPADRVLVVNSDNFVKTDLRLLPAFGDAESAMFVFKATGPKWSYAKLSLESCNIEMVAEKKEISVFATAGFYYFSSWRQYREAWRAMRKANDRTNGEFYLAPVYNYIPPQRKAFIIPSDHFIGMGTPDEFEANKHYFVGRK